MLAIGRREVPRCERIARRAVNQGEIDARRAANSHEPRRRRSAPRARRRGGPPLVRRAGVHAAAAPRLVAREFSRLPHLVRAPPTARRRLRRAYPRCCSLAARRAIAGRTTATFGRRWAGYTSSARRVAGSPASNRTAISRLRHARRRRRRRRVATAPRTRSHPHGRHLPPRAALTASCVSAARRRRSALHGEHCLRRRDRRV